MSEPWKSSASNEAKHLATPRRARILVVDDEPGLLRVLGLILGRHHELVAESKAEQALERLRAGERFDIILSDLMMPGMTGIQLLEELLRMAPDQAERLVFLTGGASTPSVREFLTTTKQHLIAKPFDAGEMLTFIAHRMKEQGFAPRSERELAGR